MRILSKAYFYHTIVYINKGENFMQPQYFYVPEELILSCENNLHDKCSL